MTPRQVERILRQARGGQSGARDRADYAIPTPSWSRSSSPPRRPTSASTATTEPVQGRGHPQKMVALGEDGLRRYIKTIGLYNNKAKANVAMSRVLIERHGGQVPGDPRGPGEAARRRAKTADVVLTPPSASRRSRSTPTSSGSRTGPGWRRPRRRSRSSRARGEGAPEIRAPRPPLADAARPLRVQGAPPRLRRLRDPRPVPVHGQDRLRLRPPASCAIFPIMNTTAATTRSPVDEPILRRLKGELQRLYGDRLERVLLFGSRARGDARPTRTGMSRYCSAVTTATGRRCPDFRISASI